MRHFILPLFIIFGLSVCVSAQTTWISPGKVILTGQIINRGESSPQTVRANFQNPFDGGGSSPAAPLDPDGSFRIEYEMPYGQSINLQYGRRFFTFHAAPGDSIQATIDAADMQIRYGGDKAGLNTLFSPAFEILTANKSFLEDSLSHDELIAAAADQLRTGRDSLAAYARREQLPAEVVRWLDHELACGALYYATMYREGEPLPEVMNRLFTEVVDIFDPRYASSQMYGVDLGWYVQRAVADMTLMDDPQALLADFLRKVKDKPAGLARDFMIFSLFSEAEQAFSGILAKFPEVPALLDSDYARQRFVSLLSPKALQFEPTPLAGISRITAWGQAEPLPEVDIFQYLAEKHRGKVIYIDVSASWCGPCIAEFPHAVTLEEALAGEDVVFVILWAESVFARTVELISEHGLPGENYFFTTDASRLFCSAYGIPGFPTYLLMDKTGKLVDMNAPRPSDPKTEARIRELLP